MKFYRPLSVAFIANAAASSTLQSVKYACSVTRGVKSIEWDEEGYTRVERHPLARSGIGDQLDLQADSWLHVVLLVDAREG